MEAEKLFNTSLPEWKQRAEEEGVAFECLVRWVKLLYGESNTYKPDYDFAQSSARYHSHICMDCRK